MLNIMGKNVLLDKSDVLYCRTFSKDSINEDWEVASGEWWIEDGWLIGRNNNNSGGIIYSKKSYICSTSILQFNGTC